MGTVNIETEKIYGVSQILITDNIIRLAIKENGSMLELSYKLPGPTLLCNDSTDLVQVTNILANSSVLIHGCVDSAGTMGNYGYLWGTYPGELLNSFKAEDGRLAVSSTQHKLEDNKFKKIKLSGDFGDIRVSSSVVLLFLKGHIKFLHCKGSLYVKGRLKQFESDKALAITERFGAWDRKYMQFY